MTFGPSPSFPRARVLAGQPGALIMGSERVLITGGAGFIGSNLADRLLDEGHNVTLFDDFSRPGGRQNVAWLRGRHPPERLRVIAADLADRTAVEPAVAGMQRIYHLGGQVAVTTSITDPRRDFESNATGTLNVLEAARRAAPDAIILYASTNKVYGGLDHLAIREEATRYAFADLPHGIAESHPLDFHSPYACSKGAGDQYTRDYARIYGLRTVVVRQSCIYGPRQLASSEQGWMAWITRAALRGERIAIYGDGKQVRDVLAVSDLLDAYDAIVRRIERATGGVYNIGGGPARTLSIWCEFGPLLEAALGRSIPARHHPVRSGDQRVYISDIRTAERELGWQPRVGVEEGVARLIDWVRRHATASV